MLPTAAESCISSQPGDSSRMHPQVQTRPSLRVMASTTARGWPWVHTLGPRGNQILGGLSFCLSCLPGLEAAVASCQLP